MESDNLTLDNSSAVANCRKTVGSPLSAIFGSFISVFGIITNLIIILALIRSKKLRKNAYISLVLMLSIFDILGGFSFLIRLIHNLIQNHISGMGNHVFCTVLLHFNFTGFIASLGQTLLICMNRLLAATNQVVINRRLFHEWRKYVTSIVMFLICNIYFLSLIPLQAKVQIVKNCKLCSMYSGTAYLLVTTLIGVVVGGMFICVLVMYIILLMVIRHQEKSIDHGPARLSAVWKSDQANRNLGGTVMIKIPSRIERVLSQKRNIVRRKFRMAALKTLSILLSVFVVLNLPAIIINVLSSSTSVPIEAGSTAVILAVLNTVANPILYTRRFTELRVELKRLFRVRQ